MVGVCFEHERERVSERESTRLVKYKLFLSIEENFGSPNLDECLLLFFEIHIDKYTML